MPRIYIRIPAIERFLKHIKITESGCWEWTGCKTRGYGSFYDIHTKQAHRFSYGMFKGAILEGLTLDHICRNRACVNPEHLEPVTLLENIERGFAGLINNHHKRKTHCPQGHPYNENNTYHIPTGGRGCKICRLERTRQFRLRVGGLA